MSDGKTFHGNKWMPIMYTTYYGIMKEICEKHGYALALHGSMLRDLDLIMVPWIDKPDPAELVFHEFRKKIGYLVPDGALPYSSKVDKPHGRIAYAIPSGSGGYLDISVTKSTTVMHEDRTCFTKDQSEAE